jgi:tRNA(adenine34) deaminase
MAAAKDEASDERMMRLALQEARRARSAGEVPIGAVLAKGSDVLGAGFNQPIASNDPTAHAEIVALRGAAQRLGNYRLPDTTLYVTLEPCLMCVGAIVNARVARVVYGASEPKFGAVESLLDARSLAANHRFEAEGGVLGDECRELMQDFFRSKRQEIDTT